MAGFLEVEWKTVSFKTSTGREVSFGSWKPAKFKQDKNLPVLKTIDRLIEEYSKNKFRIGGQITIESGHDYWWILEHGSSPRTPNPDLEAVGTGSGEKSIILQRPVGVGLSKLHRTKYPIIPNPLTKDGKLRHLIFWWAGELGNRERMKLTIVRHPGIKPRAIIRIALWRAERRLQRELGADANKTLPPRDKFVQIMNKVLIDTLAEIKRNTPEGVIEHDQPTMRHTSHLRDAYGVILAS